MINEGEMISKQALQLIIRYEIKSFGNACDNYTIKLFFFSFYFFYHDKKRHKTHQLSDENSF